MRSPIRHSQVFDGGGRSRQRPAGVGRTRARHDALGAERCAQITHVSADAADWIADVVSERLPGVVTCSTTGAKIRVYTNDMEQLPEYLQRTLGARQQSERIFRPTDSEGAQVDPAEIERMALRFTDTREQRWERIGSQAARRIEP